MAVQPIASQNLQHGYVIVTWEALGDDDTGAPYLPPTGYYHESSHVFGTFGGATFAVQGSNDGSQFVNLGTVTAEAAVAPAVQTLHWQPATSGGTGTDVDVVAYFRARY